MLYSIYLLRELHLTPILLGIVISAGGVGSLVGSLYASRVVNALGIGRALVGTAIAASVLGLILATIAISRLKPAVPSIDRSTVWIDTVKRGPMVRQVRGLGTLVPEDIRWIPANTEGRVEKINIWPGTPVEPVSSSTEALR